MNLMSVILVRDGAAREANFRMQPTTWSTTASAIFVAILLTKKSNLSSPIHTSHRFGSPRLTPRLPGALHILWRLYTRSLKILKKNKRFYGHDLHDVLRPVGTIGGTEGIPFGHIASPRRTHS